MTSWVNLVLESQRTFASLLNGFAKTLCVNKLLHYLLGGAVLVLLLGPLAALLVEIAWQPDAWQVWREADRLVGLAGRSAVLTLLVVGITLPLALPVGWLIFRTDLPARSFVYSLLFLSLVTPLPLQAAGWFMLWRHLGCPTSAEPTWRFLAAAGLHAAAALPLAVSVCGLGFRWVEPELEEEVFLCGSTWLVLRHVTWPRAQWAFWLAMLLVGLSVLNEIIVTDLLAVRTWAEEVYVEFNSGTEASARAVAACLPPALGLVALALATGDWVRRRQPARLRWRRSARIWRLGRWRYPVGVIVLTLAALPLAIPLVGLCAQAGQTGTGWSLAQLLTVCGQQGMRSGPMLIASVTVAMFAGLIVGLMSLIVLWWARGRESRQRLLWSFALLFWTLPGPLLGLALLQCILWLLTTPFGPLLRPILWDGPSPLPTLWAQVLRLWPVGLALLAPVAALVPRTWEEETRLSGAGPWPVFWLSFGRPLLPAAAATGLAVALLSLGELSTSKLVTTPGFWPLAQHLFMQMHAAADAEVASLALVLLALVASVAAGMALLVALAARCGRAA